MINKDRDRLIVEKISSQALSNSSLAISYIYSPHYGFIGYDICINKNKLNEILLYVPDSCLDFIKKYVQKDNAKALLLENSIKTKDLGLEDKIKDFRLGVIFIDDKIVLRKTPEEILQSFDARYSPHQRNTRLIH